MTSPLLLLAGFFVVVLAGIAATGYVFVLRPAGAGGSNSPGQVMADALRRVGEAVPALGKDTAPLRGRLSAAGYRWPSAVAMFNGIRWTAAAVFAGMAAWAALASPGPTAGPLLALISGAGFGHTLPELVLSALIRARARRLRAALPAALDLIVLGLEAGQSIDQAIGDTARELRHAHPDISTELAIVQFEMQVGKTRAAALQNMADRNDEAELRRVVNLIVESVRFGTSAAPALSADARHLRTRTRQQANEQARKLSVKLVFPVFFLIMPSLLLVTLGPAVIQIVQQLDALTGMGN